MAGVEFVKHVIAPSLAAEGYDTEEILSFRPEGNREGVRCVVRAKHRATGEVVAIKCLQRGSFSKKHLMREVLYHRGLVHKHIVSFKGVILTPFLLCIVMTYARDKTIQHWLTRAGAFPEQLARHMFQQIVCAVEFCHLKDLFNRDIKLENLLTTIEEEGDCAMFKIQLCDFGFSKSGADSTPRTKAGTWGYIPPEVVQSVYDKKGYDGKAADMWCLGVCLYRLVFGGFPPAVAPDVAKETWGMEAEVRRLTQLHVDIPEFQQQRPHEGQTGVVRVSDPCRALLSRLLIADPRRRITMQDLTRNEWFKEEYPEDLVGYNERLRGQYAGYVLEHQEKLLQSPDVLKALVIEAAEPLGVVGSPTSTNTEVSYY